MNERVRRGIVEMLTIEYTNSNCMSDPIRKYFTLTIQSWPDEQYLLGIPLLDMLV